MGPMVTLKEVLLASMVQHGSLFPSPPSVRSLQCIWFIQQTYMSEFGLISSNTGAALKV
jgi:hypothetical protein